jgi:hypothetical protein
MTPFDPPPINPSIFVRINLARGPIHINCGCKTPVLAASAEWAKEEMRRRQREAARLTAETN